MSEGNDSIPRPLMEIIDDELHIRPHPAQEKVLNSDKRITLVLAGNQSGKTSIGAIWMYERILEWDKRAQDPNEHLPNDICFWAVISSYPLLNEKLLPVFRDFFVRILHERIEIDLEKPVEPILTYSIQDIFVIEIDLLDPFDHLVLIELEISLEGRLKRALKV